MGPVLYDAKGLIPMSHDTATYRRSPATLGRQEPDYLLHRWKITALLRSRWTLGARQKPILRGKVGEGRTGGMFQKETDFVF